MKCINIKYLFLSLTLVSHMSYAQNLDVLASDLASANDVVEDSRIKLEVELMLKESIVYAIEQTESFNEAVGFDGEYGRFTVIPNAVIGLGLIYLGTPRVNSAINAVTPSRDIMASYLQKYRELSQNVRNAQRELNNAIENIVGERSSDVYKLRVDIFERNLSHAIVQKQNHIRTQPGSIYRLGRLARGVAKTTLIFSGLTLSVGIIGDVAMLWLPDQTNELKTQLESDIEQLNQILYPDANLQ